MDIGHHAGCRARQFRILPYRTWAIGSRKDIALPPFLFIYYTYYNIFRPCFNDTIAAATAEPHPLRFCMVERPQTPSRTECAWQRRAALSPPARIPATGVSGKGAQLCYNVKNNGYAGNRIWSFFKQRILRDGQVKEGGVLKVDSFLNHQMDVTLLNEDRA